MFAKLPLTIAGPDGQNNIIETALKIEPSSGQSISVH